jgi:Uma2 family endonuclease
VSESPTIRKATLEDLLALPEEDRNHEIIDGVLYPKQSATPRHGLAATRLAHLLAPYDRKSGVRSPTTSNGPATARKLLRFQANAAVL